MDIKKDLVLVYISPGGKTDAGGIGITASGHIIRIPPWDPGVRSLVEAAASLVAAQAQVKDAALKQQIQHTIEQIGHAVAPEINRVAQGGH